MSSPEAKRIVLVVEDDAFVRMVTVEIVEDAGFDVIEAKSAHEAISILATRSDIILVVTDVDMPGSMDGIKLAHAVSNRWPPIKIIVVSGKADMTADVLPAKTCFFAKPYSVTQIVTALDSLLGR